MTSAARDPLAERVLVYAPVGRDGALAARVLEGAGLWTCSCADVATLCEEITRGAATVMLTEEALAGTAFGLLAAALAAQPKWSDLPVVVCTTGGEGQRASMARSRALDEIGNVMVVERPMQTRTLRAAVHSGLRARRRQLVLRDMVTRLEQTAGERAALLESEQRARTEAEQANRAKDEFLAMVSHELRTPLNAILGWSRMMTADRLPDAQRERAVQTIERNAVAQAKLIDELLDVSRIISRNIRLTMRPVDLRSTIESTVESLRPTAEAKGLTLVTSLGQGRAAVMGDSERLGQVISNLIGNAIKFTPSGGRIEVALTLSSEGKACVVVRDDGIGIREDFVPHVFDRFRQGDGSRTRAHGGLGLGLAIVRHIVELHGGEVSASSEGVGKGSVLSLTIPLIAEEELGMRGSDRPPAASSGALTGLRVVIVDDEQDARDLIGAILELAGAVVTTVGSAEEAMHAIRERAPALLVSDIGMPGEDGYSLINRVRALPPESGGLVPAVALTAFSRPEDRARALCAGYTDYMTKPVDPSELVTVATRVTMQEATQAQDSE